MSKLMAWYGWASLALIVVYEIFVVWLASTFPLSDGAVGLLFLVSMILGAVAMLTMIDAWRSRRQS